MRLSKNSVRDASACGEFELIERYFAQGFCVPDHHIQLGIGDDCALFDLDASQQLAQSLDTLVAGVHFPVSIDPYLLGKRALATALSDLAAMGARPHSFLLSLTLPKGDKSWLEAFSRGLSEMATLWSIPLIGGDTTRGPLTLSLLVQGEIPAGCALRRDQAIAGDLICVSGSIGDAGAALALLQGPDCALGSAQKDYLLARYYRPDIRITLGLQLIAVGCRCCIDISDGLLADLTHILTASKVGAELDIQAVPRSQAARDQGQTLEQALTAGDDYELCFCLSPAHWRALQEMPRQAPLHIIGKIVAKRGLRSTCGLPLNWPVRGFRHF